MHLLTAHNLGQVGLLTIRKIVVHKVSEKISKIHKTGIIYADIVIFYAPE